MLDYSKYSRKAFNPDLKTSRDRKSTISLSSLFQWLVNIPSKNECFFPNLHLSGFNFQPLVFVVLPLR